MNNTPIFYPSVSSVAKNRLSAFEHIEVLSALNYPNFLISAYDIFHLNKEEKQKFQSIQEKLLSNNVDILVDSGMYEKVWAQDETWSFDNYAKTIDILNYNYVFNFDKYINPKDMPLNDILTSIQDNAISNLSPILHTSKVEDLPELCYQVAQLDKVDMIAIPERELGNGIIEGIQTISKIRQKLCSLKQYKKIHVLGTGNPISILLYSAFGVDSFDGLDWCQTVVDYDSATLHHTLQLDFFSHQSKFGSEKEMSFYARLLAHNLEFYLLWMSEINEEIKKNSVNDMLKYYLPKTVITDIEKMYGAHCEATAK